METSMKIAVILAAYDRMSTTVNNATRNAQARLSTFSKKADALAEKSFQTGKQLTAAGLAIGAPIYKAVEAAKEFETKMVDIRKQMNADNPQAVKAMTRDIFELGKQLPLATGEIQDMVAAGLRMGIAQDKIIQYTRDVTKMAVAFDMPAAQIADSMGKISNVFKIPIDKVGDFADAINYLDDNTMAKGPELIDVLQRIGGSAKALSPNAAAALASTMLSLGESAETSGSGISAMINRLSAATMQSKKFQTGISMLGLDSAKLQKQMSDKSTAQYAILDVFEKINGLKPEKQTEALIRLFGNEQGPKLMKLAGNVAEYRRQLQLVNGQQKGSMDKEYSKRIAASAAQTQLFKNRVQELAVKAGATLLPALNKLLASAGKWMDRLSAFIEAHPKLVEGLMKAAAVASALALAGGYLSFVFGGVFKAFSVGATVIRYLISAFNILKTVFMVMRVVIMAFPLIGWILAIATAAFLIYKYWDQIKAFFQRLWPAVVNIFKKFVGWLKFLFLNFTPYGLIFKHWSKITAFFSRLWDGAKKIFWSAVAFIVKLAPNFFRAGGNIVMSIWNGIKKFASKPVEAIRGIVSKIRNMLPFSPAKDGPLKDIHRIKLIETIAESIKPASMINAMRKTAAAAMNFLTGRQPGPGVRPSGASAQGGFSMSVTINLSGGATKKDAELITSNIERQFSRLMEQYNNKRKRVGFSF